MLVPDLGPASGSLRSITAGMAYWMAACMTAAWITSDPTISA